MSPVERELEFALGQLKPIANMLNRDELMFNAGRAAAGRKVPWQMLSGVLCVLLIASVLTRPNANASRKTTTHMNPGRLELARTSNHPVPVESGGSLEYVTLREKVIEEGLDALPLPQGAGNGEPFRSQRQWLESMLSS